MSNFPTGVTKMSKTAYFIIAAIVAIAAGVYFFVIRPKTLTGTPAPENQIVGPGGTDPQLNYESMQRVGSDTPAVPVIIPVNEPYKGEPVTPIGTLTALMGTEKILTDTGAIINVPTNPLMQSIQTGPGGSFVYTGAPEVQVIQEQAALQWQYSNYEDWYKAGFSSFEAWNADRLAQSAKASADPWFLLHRAFDPVTQSWYIKA
jgi:hypothetical protein